MSMMPFLLVQLTLCISTAGPQEKKFEDDFEQCWSFLIKRYAYPERIQWNALKTAYSQKAKRAANEEAFLRVIEEMLEQLGDAHTHLGTNFADSWWLPPGDIAAELRNNQVMVLAVYPNSPAWRGGIRPGMQVTAINGLTIQEAIKARSPRFIQQKHNEIEWWTINSVLAGRRLEKRKLVVVVGGNTTEVTLEPSECPARPDRQARLINNSIGYIGFDHFGGQSQVKRLDDALKQYPQAKAWILDVRSNTGGDTMVIKPIMGRFLEKSGVFAKMLRREGEALGHTWQESVSPRGVTFTGPLVILVDPWTMSVAEGMAMGLDGLNRATVIGTRMAGLGAAVNSITLKHSKVRVQISTEPVFHVSGLPRNQFRPKVIVPLDTAENLQKEDPILESALKHLQLVN